MEDDVEVNYIFVANQTYSQFEDILDGFSQTQGVSHGFFQTKGVTSLDVTLVVGLSQDKGVDLIQVI